jgi:periplasmic mercuric ion binding protein
MMKLRSMVLVGATFVGFVALPPAYADSKIVTLSVPGMDCDACPITVSKALKKVDGVEKVAASLEQKEAVVTFDDAKTNVDALRRATANAGYPSMVKQ